MAWSFTNLSYGWKYVVGVVLAGTTIYVASNTRWRVNQADVIELALGVHERCLATQTATNPTYAVDPPSFVRSWYSNSYVTTNVPGDAVTNWTAQLHTNVFTNVIGWRTDRAMMVELDAKIKELVPHYVDTDSVYDGTTNIIMHTFTGLLTSLDLGNHTNFTAIPAIGTNAATYGPWAWRNYVVAWQERYKVLEALKIIHLGGNVNFRSKYALTQPIYYPSYAEAQAATLAKYATVSELDAGELSYAYSEGHYWGAAQYEARCAVVTGFVYGNIPSLLVSNVASVDLYGIADPGYDEFDADGVPNLTTNAWHIIRTLSSPISANIQITVSDDFTPVSWPTTPTSNDTYRVKGYRFDYFPYGDNLRMYVNWQFNYCTNKYW